MRVGLALLLTSTLALAQVVEGAFRGDPGPLDFIRGTGPDQAILQALAGDALVGVDAKGALVPRLAHRWELRGHELRFSLRRDATFPDGTHVSAQDALWTLQELQRDPGADPEKRQALAGAGLFIQARQLVVRSPRPADSLLRDLARIPIARRGHREQGSGPFHLLKAGPEWQLHRRAHFLGPRLEGFHFRIVPEVPPALREGRLHLGVPGPTPGPLPPSHRALTLVGSGEVHWVDHRLEAEGSPAGLFGGTPGPAAWRWRQAPPKVRR